MFCGKINTSFCSIELAHSLYPTSQICVIESYSIHPSCDIYLFSLPLVNRKSMNKIQWEYILDNT